MEKKKILVLNVAMLLGGAETVLVNYLNILAKNPNYEVHLSVFEGMEKYNLEKIDPSVKIDFLLNDIETQFNRYSYSASVKENITDGERNYYKSWNNYTNNVRLDRLINKINVEDYDLIIDFLATSIAFIKNDYLVKIKKPIIYWIHSSNDLNKWFLKEEYKDNLNCIDTFIAICDDMKSKCDYILCNEFKLNKKTAMLYNPVDNNRISNLMNMGLSQDESLLLESPFILSVGRLDGGKNHLKMIDLFSKLKEKGIAEKLYIIGNGAMYSALQDRIEQLALNDDCLLLGAKENPFPFMKKAKLFIHTSTYEGLPTVFIESMICGVPIVSFDCPTGPREILENGKYGELIPMGDDELFVEKTYELLINEQRRQHYISLLPEAVERFSFDKIGQQFFELIAEVKNKTRN